MKGFGGGWPGGRILERMGPGPGGTAAVQFEPADREPSRRDEERGATQSGGRRGARGLQAMPEDAQSELMERVKVEAGDGRYETFKSTTEYRRAASSKTARFRLAPGLCDSEAEYFERVEDGGSGIVLAVDTNVEIEIVNACQAEWAPCRV